MGINVDDQILVESLYDLDTKLRRETNGGRLRATLAKIQHLDLTENLSYGEDAEFISGGAYGDIRIGTSTIQDRGNVKVAVKCLRLYLQQRPEVTRLLERELNVWSSLNHVNVLPLLGYSIEESGLPSLVSEFMENGTVLHYVERHPELDVLGIAKGAGYLHDNGIIHSDLKSDNVLISPSGEPLICDFGVSRMISLSQTLSGYGARMQHSTSTIRGSVRWMSPELLMPVDNQQAIHTFASDVWAFGMTVYELLTRRRPYYHLITDPQVITAIIRDGLPDIPETYGPWPPHYLAIWNLCHACWLKEPIVRPKMSHIIARLDVMLSEPGFPLASFSSVIQGNNFGQRIHGLMPPGLVYKPSQEIFIPPRPAEFSPLLSGVGNIPSVSRSEPGTGSRKRRMRERARAPSTPSESLESEASEDIPPSPQSVYEPSAIDITRPEYSHESSSADSGIKKRANSLWTRAFRRRWSKGS